MAVLVDAFSPMWSYFCLSHTDALVHKFLRVLRKRRKIFPLHTRSYEWEQRTRKHPRDQREIPNELSCQGCAKMFVSVQQALLLSKGWSRTACFILTAAHSKKSYLPVPHIMTIFRIHLNHYLAATTCSLKPTQEHEQNKVKRCGITPLNHLQMVLIVIVLILQSTVFLYCEGN